MNGHAHPLAEVLRDPAEVIADVLRRVPPAARQAIYLRALARAAANDPPIPLVLALDEIALARIARVTVAPIAEEVPAGMRRCDKCSRMRRIVPGVPLDACELGARAEGAATDSAPRGANGRER